VFVGHQEVYQVDCVCARKTSRAAGRHEHPTGVAGVRPVAKDHPEDATVFVASSNHVGSLRRYRNIALFQPSAGQPTGELGSIRKTAKILGMNSSIHRWLANPALRLSPVTLPP
jgi:hypothetical protein